MSNTSSISSDAAKAARFIASANPGYVDYFVGMRLSNEENLTRDELRAIRHYNKFLGGCDGNMFFFSGLLDKIADCTTPGDPNKFWLFIRCGDNHAPLYVGTLNNLLYDQAASLGYEPLDKDNKSYRPGYDDVNPG